MPNAPDAAPDYCNLLDPVIELAREASRRIVEVYNTDFSVAQKKNNTPLTEADMVAHRTILDGLGRMTPNWPVLSEESAEVSYAERAHWQRYWLVDPLDGTREFIKRNGEFTVNIALIDQHYPVLGVVCIPVSGHCYYACKSQGAFKLNSDRPERIRVRRAPMARLIVAGSRSHRGDSLKRFLAKLGDYELLSMGSSLKSCLIAEGRADVYPRLGPTGEWDTAAAQCIVEEAGGQVTDIALQRLRYNKESLLNPDFLVFGDARVDWRRFLDD